MSEPITPEITSPPFRDLAFRIDAAGVAIAGNAAARGLFGPDPVALTDLFSPHTWPAIEAHLADRARLTFDPAGLLAVTACGRPVWVQTSPAPGGGCTLVAQLALPGLDDAPPPPTVPAGLADGDEPLVWIAPDGRIRAAARSVAPLLGVPQDALAGVPWDTFAPLEPSPGPDPGAAVRIARTLTGADGRPRRLDIASRRLPDGGLLVRLAPSAPEPLPVPWPDPLDALPCALLLVDPSERIRLVSGRLLPDLALDPAALTDAPLDALSFPCARRQIRAALEGERSTRRVALGAVPLECHAAPVHDADGALAAAAFLVLERSQLEDEHDRARRDAVARGLRQLAAVAAHDLSNALAVIRCHLDLARDEPGVAGLHAHIDDIEAAARAAADVSQRLLAVGERRPLDLRTHDLVRVLARITPDLHVAARPARCEIVVAATPCPADVDAGAVRDALVAVTGCLAAQEPAPARVLVQLRARHFGEDHARWLGLPQAGHFAVISVSDRPLAAHLDPPPPTDSGAALLANDLAAPNLELLSASATVRRHGGLLEQLAPGAWRAYLPLTRPSLQNS